MMILHKFVHTRRASIRRFTFALFLGTMLFGAIFAQRHMTKTYAAERNRLCRAVLAHMNEENDALRQALAQQDTAAVRRHADTLCGYASLIETFPAADGDDAVLDALSDTAQFYSALSGIGQTDSVEDLSFWKSAADTVSSHIAAIALSLPDRQNPLKPTETETDAAAMLAAFSSSFRADPIRIPSSAAAGFQFDHEPVISPAQARQILRTLIGNTASFLGNTVTDDIHGCYIFSCQNGYAEISRCGGHLLSYAFYPRGNSNARGVTVCDSDLQSAAVEFLEKAGLPHGDLSVLEDRHGIRTFVSQTDDHRTVSVGIRMHDGAVVSCQAESYYRLADDGTK